MINANYLFSDGPEVISIIPQPSLRNGHLVMKEGDLFGPYTCSVSCNPPCNIVWTYNTTSSSERVNTNEGCLPQQPVNRTFTSLSCLARWESNPPKKEVIRLNVQCKYLIVILHRIEKYDLKYISNITAYRFLYLYVNSIRCHIQFIFYFLFFLLNYLTSECCYVILLKSKYGYIKQLN